MNQILALPCLYLPRASYFIKEKSELPQCLQDFIFSGLLFNANLIFYFSQFHLLFLTQNTSLTSGLSSNISPFFFWFVYLFWLGSTPSNAWAFSTYCFLFWTHSFPLSYSSDQVVLGIKSDPLRTKHALQFFELSPDHIALFLPQIYSNI